MSEPVPEAEGQPKPKPKRKGGLPWWGWAAIGVAVVAGIVIWRKRSASSQASTGASVGPPETTVPVPTGTGLTGSQYAALASQNAAIYEAIQDMQGEKSEEKKEDRDKDDRDKGDRRDKASTTTKTPQPLSGQENAFGPPTHGVTSNQRKTPRGTHRLGNGRIVPNSVG